MINKRVVELRKKLRLNQADFAKRIGFTRSFIALIETERNPLTEANIKLICYAFGVNEDWLRTGNGDIFLQNRSYMEDEVLEMFRGLSEKAQVMIRDYIKMVLDQQQALQLEHTAPPPAREDMPAGFPLEPRRSADPAPTIADFQEEERIG